MECSAANSSGSYAAARRSTIAAPGKGYAFSTSSLERRLVAGLAMPAAAGGEAAAAAAALANSSMRAKIKNPVVRPIADSAKAVQKGFSQRGLSTEGWYSVLARG